MRASPLRPAPFKAVLALALSVLAAFGAPVAKAQSPFAAALYVNDDAITNYEITQKMRFLEFLGAAGDNPRERAIERLIEDRLQMQEVTRLGGRLTPDDLATGLTEFAARANLTTEEMLTQMAAAGIDRETVVEFIRAGVMWRALIQTRYRGQIQVTDSQIDQALSVEGVQPTTEILISEIFLPADEQFAEAVQRIIPQIQRIRSETEFSNAARQVSAAPSGPSGGRVDRWINVAGLPEPMGGVMASAPVGTVIGPLDMPGAYAFFQLRARRESRAVPAEATALDFRRVGLPGGRSEANLARVERIRAGTDSCTDFNAIALREAPELPGEAIEELSRRLTELSAAERTELERLNPGQISANLVEGDRLQVMMLCARRVSEDLAPPREEVRVGLMNRALEGQALVYLQRLRAEADIRYP